MPARAVCADDAGVTCCLEVQLPCPPLLSRFRTGSAALGIVFATTSCGLAGRVRGLSPYRAPSVVLAYPDRGVAHVERAGVLDARCLWRHDRRGRRSPVGTVGPATVRRGSDAPAAAPNATTKLR